MPERYVKTVELSTAQRPTAQPVYCADCFNNMVTAARKTTQDDGRVCKRCDGSGLLWRLAGEGEPHTPEGGAE